MALKIEHLAPPIASINCMSFSRPHQYTFALRVLPDTGRKASRASGTATLGCALCSSLVAQSLLAVLCGLAAFFAVLFANRLASSKIATRMLLLDDLLPTQSPSLAPTRERSLLDLATLRFSSSPQSQSL